MTPGASAGMPSAGVGTRSLRPWLIALSVTVVEGVVLVSVPCRTRLPRLTHFLALRMIGSAL